MEVSGSAVRKKNPRVYSGASEGLKMMQYEVKMKKKMKKSLRKVCRFRKSPYLCNPVTKQGHLTEANELR